MVDSIKNIGSAAPAAPKRSVSTALKAPVSAAKGDHVVISPEALSLQQAEKTAAATREILTKSELTLGLQAGFASET